MSGGHVEQAQASAQAGFLRRRDESGAAIGPALPLSWGRTTAAQPTAHHIPLPLSGLQWITQANLPQHYDFKRFYHEYLRPLRGGFVIRGCNPAQAHFLAAQGVRVARIGCEALVDLHGPGMQRHAVQKMVRQAARQGHVHELPWSSEAAVALQELVQRSRYGARPQLRHLFRTAFTPDTRLFVFDGTNGARHGALLISQPQPQLAVTELMLRVPSAPGGVMESLFRSVATRLRSEGVRTLSLNEVPFQLEAADIGGWERLIQAGAMMLHGAYNAAGLQHFKAKFAPQWRPAYLCAAPQISLQLLIDLFVASGCLRLTTHHAFQVVRARSITFLHN
ncbi:MAG: DUF2156 domain-containing protein [Oscillochloris sp.]|nr:DUF2156 domain-containing protein [Oscillochloris sp.]